MALGTVEVVQFAERLRDLFSRKQVGQDVFVHISAVETGGPEFASMKDRQVEYENRHRSRQSSPAGNLKVKVTFCWPLAKTPPSARARRVLVVSMSLDFNVPSMLTPGKVQFPRRVFDPGARHGRDDRHGRDRSAREPPRPGRAR